MADRREISGDGAHTARTQAEERFSGYVDFVRRCAPPGEFPKLAELGCRDGWSSRLLSEGGYDVTGVDVDPRRAASFTNPRLHFVTGNFMRLPFASECFDVVSSSHLLEHLSDPPTSLREMVRVCRRGGVVVINGPNLISAAGSLRRMVKLARHPIASLVHDPATPHHPFGDTLIQAAATTTANLWRLVAKSFAREATFLMREPDLRPPMREDSDACYLLNPIDLALFLPANGCRVERTSAWQTGRLMGLLATETWIAARRE